MKNKFTARTPEEFAAYWDKLNPPIRPSEDMVAIYDRALRQNGYHESGEWGLLGCTPEIRSLAAEYGRPLTCIDRSVLAYKAFRLLCNVTQKECFIEDDWADANCQGQFDLVIGDGSISMLSPERHKAFIENLHSMIKPKGMALLRVQVRDGCIFDNPRELISWYRNLKEQCSISTCTRGYLQMMWADPKTGSIVPDRFQNGIEELYEKGMLTEQEHQDFLSQPMKLTVNFTTRKDFENLIMQYFEVIDTVIPADFLSSEHFPIYILKRK